MIYVSCGAHFSSDFFQPTFFHYPQSDYLFCDNPMELDQLCRHLVREAPAHLNEGGYMQMLCEWAQVGEQPWESGSPNGSRAVVAMRGS